MLVRCWRSDDRRAFVRPARLDRRAVRGALVGAVGRADPSRSGQPPSADRPLHVADRGRDRLAHGRQRPVPPSRFRRRLPSGCSPARERFLQVGLEPGGRIWPGVLLLLAWIASFVVAVRMRHRSLIALDTVIAVTLLLSLVSMSQHLRHDLVLPDALGVGHDDPPDRRHRVDGGSGDSDRRAVRAGGDRRVAGARRVGDRVDGDRGPEHRSSGGTAGRRRSGRCSQPTIDALDSGVGAADGRDGRYVVQWNDAYFFGSQGFGLVNELERAGFDVGMYEPWHVPVTQHRVIPVGQATAEVVWATGGFVDQWRADDRVGRGRRRSTRSPTTEREQFDDAARRADRRPRSGRTRRPRADRRHEPVRGARRSPALGRRPQEGRPAAALRTGDGRVHRPARGGDAVTTGTSGIEARSDRVRLNGRVDRRTRAPLGMEDPRRGDQLRDPALDGARHPPRLRGDRRQRPDRAARTATCSPATIRCSARGRRRRSARASTSTIPDRCCSTSSRCRSACSAGRSGVALAIATLNIAVVWVVGFVTSRIGGATAAIVAQVDHGRSRLDARQRVALRPVAAERAGPAVLAGDVHGVGGDRRRRRAAARWRWLSARSACRRTSATCSSCRSCSPSPWSWSSCDVEPAGRGGSATCGRRCGTR